MQQKIVQIEGMHCRSCEILVREKLEDLPGVIKAKVSVKTNNAVLTAEALPTESAIAEAVASAGYKVGDTEKTFVTRDKRVYRDVLIGVGLVLILALVLGGRNWDVLGGATTWSSNVAVVGLVAGITAGISTCMALVGGLVLGISAKHAERYPSATVLQRFRPHIFFNIGRIAGFTFLGALIGGAGAFFQLSGTVLGWLMILVSIVMIVLGLNLTGIFPKLSSITLPPKIAEKLGVSGRDKREYTWFGSFVTGVLTFFLPCGFTQAMQLMAIGSGSPLTGALIMGMFAVGTTPGLIGIGGLTSVVQGKFAKTFFRIIGVGVVSLAIINFSGAITLADIRMPDIGSIFRQEPVVLSQDTKRFDVVFNPSRNPDISPSSFTTKVGQKTALVIDATMDGQGCMSTIMVPGLYNKPIYLQKGKQIVLEFTPTTPGEYKITCAMGVPRGAIKVEA